MKRISTWTLTGAVACLALTSCSKKTDSGPKGPPIVQVVAVEAKRQPVAETLSLVGSVAAKEMVEIKSETDGVVQEIRFKEGLRVEKGQLLVQLDESKLAATLAEAEANFKLSRANHERAQQLYNDKLISQQEFDQAAATYNVNQASLDLKKRELKDTRIYAPFSGIVGARYVSPGQVISKNTTLTYLIDIDPVVVEFNVPERFLSQLHVDQIIEIGVATYQSRKFKGKVYFVSSFVDLATRTALVKAYIPNPDAELKPGMFANLDLTLTIRENSVVIPEVAISQLLEDSRANVYVVGEGSKVVLAKVTLGVRLAGRVEVVEGLKGGEKVIVEGLQKIGPGSTVKLAPPESAAAYEEKEAPTQPRK
ncbi:MAG: efflux RND transporter periplasmic adaptor subunit [Verrucomicrobia bacterium]|nr:efflux RND transporter periplasmic adaptor subunit [Verrucomicrobiota bacterium]